MRVLPTLILISLLPSCVTRGTHPPSLPGTRSAIGSADGKDLSPALSGLPVSASGFVPLPQADPAFWKSLMTPAIAQEYRAAGGRTQCTRFVGDSLKARFGPGVFEAVFPDGVKGANETFLDWAANPSLVRLMPGRFSIAEILDLSERGYLVLMAYYFTGVAGHVAFVGHSDLDLFTVPPLPGLEGRSGRDLDAEWLPVMVQAGTYTGVTSMVYATNGWLTGDNYASGAVRYYLVKRP